MTPMKKLYEQELPWFLSGCYSLATVYVNVALKKPAFISSLYSPYIAEYGVDGDNASLINFVRSNGSSFQYSGWFVVDLVNAYQAKFVTVFNRADQACTSLAFCYKRMNYFIVGLTNYFDAAVNSTATIRGNYDLCGQWPVEVTTAGQVMSVNCVDQEKFYRFVIIQQSLQVEQYVTDLVHKAVQFVEMEVYTNKSFLQYENVALKKPAYMSTPDSTYIANNCVDGSKGNNNLCKLTTETTPFKNWFIVDLTRNYQVLYAVLYTFDLQDKGVPENVASLWNLRHKMLSLADPNVTNMIVVHCSAGVGRTGTYIALDYLANEAEQTGCVDVFECLKYMRGQRYNMVQAFSQYELCFRAIVLYYLMGKSTYISSEDKDECVRQLEEFKIKKGVSSIVEKQFQARLMKYIT
ncbi:hypothetical protein HELRODRAFT_163142 [Helobdella robusta]|uniref:Protein-tyrosine-phosphatase n=1 Tax=Helobdella robusta TaxID=6412 RepID=T1ETQ0_HELRO|nr:hypothetical protein HELRODRAFT_163142 [Helobdella robusta]ESN96114.1 hypothetical protein HELRODRAFT_163142 [Helobdella robusta]